VSLYDFFLAHAGPDTAQAERLYDLLAAETSVFLDSRSIVLGDDWDRVLAEAQRQSRVTVVLVSANTDVAFYQREEIATAIDLARTGQPEHRVVPVYLEHPASNVPYGLRLKHGLAISSRQPMEQVAARLIDLHRILVVEVPAGRLISAVRRPLQQSPSLMAEPSAHVPPLANPVATSANIRGWIVEANPRLWLRSGPGFEYRTVGSLEYGRRAYGNCGGVESGGTAWYLLHTNGDGWAWGNSAYLTPV
jgi:hypothetical protein